MDSYRAPSVLQIKKYPNRRYYDTTRSCHVTLHEVYDLIMAGKDVCITDSKTGEDITNLVLTQILLEQDQPKLDIFPASIFHLMIRSNRQAIGGYVERFLAPMWNLWASSQKQFDHYVRETVAGKMMSPMDWARGMMSAFGVGQGSTPSPGHDSEPPADWNGSPDGQANDPEDLDELRRQAAELMHRIERLTRATDGNPGKT